MLGMDGGTRGPDAVAVVAAAAAAWVGPRSSRGTPRDRVPSRLFPVCRKLESSTAEPEAAASAAESAVAVVDIERSVERWWWWWPRLV